MALPSHTCAKRLSTSIFGRYDGQTIAATVSVLRPHCFPNTPLCGGFDLAGFIGPWQGRVGLSHRVALPTAMREGFAAVRTELMDIRAALARLGERVTLIEVRLDIPVGESYAAVQ